MVADTKRQQIARAVIAPVAIKVCDLEPACGAAGLQADEMRLACVVVALENECSGALPLCRACMARSTVTHCSAAPAVAAAFVLIGPRGWDQLLAVRTGLQHLATYGNRRCGGSGNVGRVPQRSQEPPGAEFRVSVGPTASESWIGHSTPENDSRSIC